MRSGRASGDRELRLPRGCDAPGHVPGVDGNRTPIRYAQHGLARLYRPDSDGQPCPVGPTIEAITGRCVEPPGRRGMTYCVLPVVAGAMGSDRLVGDGQTIRLEYRVPMTSTRQALVDHEMDVLGWLGSDLAVVEVWLAGHELWMGRRVRARRPPG